MTQTLNTDHLEDTMLSEESQHGRTNTMWFCLLETPRAAIREQAGAQGSRSMGVSICCGQRQFEEVQKLWTVVMATQQGKCAECPDCT